MDNWPPFDTDNTFPDAFDLADGLDQAILDELFRNDANVERPLATQPQGPQPHFSSGDIGPQLNYPATLSNGNMDTVVNPAFGAATASQNSLMPFPWESGFQQGYNNAFAVDASLWASAPFGADLSIHPDVAWGPPAWAAPLGALGAHDPSNLLAEPGSGAENAPARAGFGRKLGGYVLRHPIFGSEAGPHSYKKCDGKFHCIIQPCNRPAFSRLADLQRHQNAYHFGNSAFWCSATGCNRSRSHPYGRAFPRKDKRNDHEKKVHGGVLSVD